MNIKPISEEQIIRETALEQSKNVHSTNSTLIGNASTPLATSAQHMSQLNTQDEATLDQHEKSGKVLITILTIQTFLITSLAFTYNIVFFKLEGSHDFSSQISVGVLFMIIGLGLLSRAKIARIATITISWVLAVILILLIPLAAFGFLLGFIYSPYEAMKLLLVASPLLFYPLVSLIILNMKRVSRLFN